MGEDGREKGIKANNNNISNNPSSPNSIMTLPQENGSGLIEAPVAVPVLTSPVRYAALFYFLSHYISLFFTFLFCLPFFIFFVTHSQIVYLSLICFFIYQFAIYYLTYSTFISTYIIVYTFNSLIYSFHQFIQYTIAARTTVQCMGTQRRNLSAVPQDFGGRKGVPQGSGGQ